MEKLKSQWLIENSGRNSGLDFLRSMAILLVLARHFLDRNSTYDAYIPEIVKSIGLAGWAGVDLFYVLSGFLIFSRLFRDESAGRYRARDFYIRRILRIWPAYYVSLLICVLAGEFAANPHFFAYFFFFLQNYVPGSPEVNGGIYWSIAVEEHFYILAPLILLIARHRKGHRLAFLISLVVMPLVIRYATYEWIVQDDRNKFYTYIYFPTHERFDTISIGVLCAYIVSEYRWILDKWLVRTLVPLGWAASAAAAWFLTAPLSEYLQQPSIIGGTLGYSMTAVFWAFTVMMSVMFGIFNPLGRGVLRIVAHLSFSMYLYHMLVLQTVNGFFQDTAADGFTVLIHAGIFVVGTMAAAFLSYILVERHFLIWKKRLGKSAVQGSRH